MAPTNAGPAEISGGAGEATAEGKATKKPKPPVRTLTPGPLTPYDFYDAVTPDFPLQPKANAKKEPRVPEPKPKPPRTPRSYSPWSDYHINKHVKEVLNGATDYFNLFGAKTPRVTGLTVSNMAAPQLIFVDGSFAELAQEMADYVQAGDKVKPYLDKEQNEEALHLIVQASQYLNSVPEKDFAGAYNLLIHLVLQSKDPKKLLPTVCSNLQKPITSSPVHGFTLAINALSTIFNLLERNNPLRYNVFLQIIRLIRQHGQYEVLKPRLKNLEGWFEAWDTDEDDQRRLYIEVSDAAADAGDDE
jgi:translation initiation factor 3 subunit M